MTYKIPTLTLQEAEKLFDEKKLVGIFHMENQAYHAAPGLSKSSLDAIREGPEYFVYKMNHPDDMSTALIVGSAYHNAIMKDEPFDSLFYLNKTQPTRPERDDQGRAPLSHANKALCDAMAEAFMADPKNKMLLEGAIFEVCSFWVDEETGVLLKSKEDIFLPEKGLIVDLKSIADLNKIQWAVKDHRHHVKAAFALDGFGNAMRQSGNDYGFRSPDTFGFAYQEKEAPFRVRRRKFEPNSLVFGEKLYREDIATYLRCVETGIWLDEEKLFTDYQAPGANAQWD